MFLSLLTSLRVLLRPTPSVREAHRRYLLHLRDDGSCDFAAAGLTDIEHEALKWVLRCSPEADKKAYDLATALATWWPEHEHLFDFSMEGGMLCHQVVLLLERWEKQVEAAKYSLNMPPHVRVPFGSVIDDIQF